MLKLKVCATTACCEDTSYLPLKGKECIACVVGFGYWLSVYLFNGFMYATLCIGETAVAELALDLVAMELLGGLVLNAGHNLIQNSWAWDVS